MKLNLSKEMDLTTGDTKTLIKKVIVFALPIMLVGVLEVLFNTFDLLVIEAFKGQLEGDAVGTNAAFIALLTNVFIGLSTGENVVISLFYGQKDHKSATNAAYSGIVLSLISGVIVMLIGYFISPYLLKMMNVSSEYYSYALTYLRTFFFCLPFMSLYNFGSAIFRGIGDSTTPLVFLVIAGLLHIALNFLFIVAFDLSVLGAGLSNILSYLVASILVLIFLRFKHSFLNFKFTGIRLYKKETIMILKIGIPSGIHGMIFAVSNMILQASVNTWGHEVVLANADSESIENFVYVSMFSFAQAGSAFIAANYGKGEKENITKLIKILVLITAIYGLIIGCIVLALYKPLILIYTGNKASDEMLALCFERLVLLLPTYFLCGIMDTVTNILRGLKRAVVPMIISICFVCLFRVFWNFCIYSNDPNSTMHSTIILYTCYPVSWVCSTLLQCLYFFINKKKIYSEVANNSALKS